MANFSSKVFGLVGTAMLFAGMSYGQQLTFTPGTANGIIIDRIEDTTALVGDLSLTATAAQPPTTNPANVVVTLSLPVTSLAISSAKASEAVLTINGGGPVLGVVSGNTITFSAVTFPAGPYTLLIQNVRVNASQGTIGSSITESVTIQSNGYLNYASPAPVQVGVIQQGFNKPGVTANTTVASYVICTGNPVGGLAAASKPSFSISVSQGFSGALKVTGTGAPLAGNLITTAEQGSNPTASGLAGAGAAGIATHGTRFAVTFANIPSGVTIYVPTTITGSELTASEPAPPAPKVYLTLTLGSQGATGALKMAAAANPTGWAPAAPYNNVVPVAGGANGTATVYYDVTTTDNVTANLSFAVVGFVTAAAGFTTAPTTAITVLVAPAPTSGTDIPTFAASSNTAVNINAFGACATNLLFPFVSTAGFDTGIAISNTGTDPLGTSGAGTSAPGGCSLFFYGSGGTPPAQGAAAPFGSGATLGVLPSPAAPNYTGTFLLSGVVGTGFTGYMIATCNFLYGHGFAYIDYGGLGAPTSVALGYLAQVLPNYTAAAPRSASLFESLGN